jgi:signal transduction histidine kinase
MVVSELELRQSVRKTQQAQNFAHNIVVSSPDCIQVVAANGKLLSTNGQNASLLEACTGVHLRNCYWPDIWGAAGRSDALRCLAAATSGEMAKFRVPLTTAAGANRWWEVVVSPFAAETGTIDSVLSVARDVTLEMETQLELAQTNDEIRKASCALERSNQELEVFARVASHDLRAPLNTINQFLSLLKRHLGDRVDATSEAYLNFVTGGARRLEKLISDLLLYSGISAHNQQPTEAACSQLAFDSAVANLSAAILETEATVTSANLPLVQLEPTHLLQLFQNLIGNALNYRSEKPPRIHVSATVSGSYASFVVEDNGIGIAECYRKLIFEPFKRLHGTDKSGSGVGLSICQKIVDQAGGRIWVESEVGVGSRFCFEIPIADMAATA